MHNSSGLLLFVVVGKKKAALIDSERQLEISLIHLYIVSVPVQTRLRPSVEGRLGKEREEGEAGKTYGKENRRNSLHAST